MVMRGEREMVNSELMPAMGADERKESLSWLTDLEIEHSDKDIR